MIRVFAFDLDGTLTQHKTAIEDENRKILDMLSKKYKLLMVGAGECMRIHNQLCEFPIDVIGNYGMQYAKNEGGEFRLVRDDVIPCTDKASVEDRINMLRQKYGYTKFAGDNVEYHSSGCITFPLLGTKALQADKLAFDPDRRKRRAFYDDVCETFSDYNVFVGGSSSFDMAPKPFNKYYALDLWCREHGFDHSEVLFVGDDYGIGGNDESVYRSNFRFVCIDDYTRLGEVLAPWIDESVTDVDELLGAKDRCLCGKSHFCNVGRVVIRNGAINELPAMTSDFRNILLVSDENTHRVCGGKVERLIVDKISDRYIYSGKELVIPDEEAVAKLECIITAETDLIIGVGSGVINDICKYVSHAHNLPYYIVATAPSMDGYASSGAAMLFNGMKITTSAAVPSAIIADTAILRDAPLEMLKAGYGDIIGKYSCLNDWKLSHIVNDEPICEFIYDLTYKAVASVASMGNEIISRDEKSVAALMRALVIVGIAMAYMGNSRPASGSEHHISHFFEVMGIIDSQPYFPHGIDVAYSTVITSYLRGKIIKSEFSNTLYRLSSRKYIEKINQIYKSVANGCIQLQEEVGNYANNRLNIYIDKEKEIKKVLSSAPTAEEIKNMLCTVELDMADFYALYDAEKISNAISYAKDLKDRYTVLWLYYDLFGDKILN